jgi:hypothetical protein
MPLALQGQVGRQFGGGIFDVLAFLGAVDDAAKHDMLAIIGDIQSGRLEGWIHAKAGLDLGGRGTHLNQFFRFFASETFLFQENSFNPSGCLFNGLESHVKDEIIFVKVLPMPAVKRTDETRQLAVLLFQQPLSRLMVHRIPFHHVFDRQLQGPNHMDRVHVGNPFQEEVRSHADDHGAVIGRMVQHRTLQQGTKPPEGPVVLLPYRRAMFIQALAPFLPLLTGCSDIG